MVQFVDHPLRLLNPRYDSPLLDVLTALEHLRRLQMQGTTGARLHDAADGLYQRR